MIIKLDFKNKESIDLGVPYYGYIYSCCTAQFTQTASIFFMDSPYVSLPKLRVWSKTMTFSLWTRTICSKEYEHNFNPLLQPPHQQLNAIY